MCSLHGLKMDEGIQGKGIQEALLKPDSREWLSTSRRIFLRLDFDHENVAKNPQANVEEGNPRQAGDEAHDAPDVLRITDYPKRKLRHPWNALPKTHAIVSPRFSQKLIHPAFPTTLSQCPRLERTFVRKNTCLHCQNAR